MVRELEGMLHEAVGRLGSAHVAALVTHPDAVRSALAVAADVLSVDDAARRDGTGPGVETIAGAAPNRVDVKEADRRLAARTREARRSAPSGRRAPRAARICSPSPSQWGSLSASTAIIAPSTARRSPTGSAA